MTKRLEEKAEGLGITLMQGPTGFTLLPFKEGKVLSTEQFNELPENEQKKLNERLEEIIQQLIETMINKAGTLQYSTQTLNRQSTVIITLSNHPHAKSN
jgi:paraquat-inducible protein B